MKKATALLLTVFLIIGFTGCSGSDEPHLSLETAADTESSSVNEEAADNAESPEEPAVSSGDRIEPGNYVSDGKDHLYIYNEGVGILFDYHDTPGLYHGVNVKEGLEIENTKLDYICENGVLSFSYRDRDYVLQYDPATEMKLGASDQEGALNLTGYYINASGLTMIMQNDGTGSLKGGDGDTDVYWGSIAQDDYVDNLMIIGSYMTGVYQDHKVTTFNIDDNTPVAMSQPAFDVTGNDGQVCTDEDNHYSVILTDDSWTWELREAETGNSIQFKGDGGSIAIGVVGSTGGSFEAEELDGVCDMIIQSSQAQFPDMTMQTSACEDLPVSGLYGRAVTAQLDGDGNTVVAVAVAFADKETVYMAYMNALSDKYEDTARLMFRMLDSFRYTD